MAELMTRTVDESAPPVRALPVDEFAAAFGEPLSQTLDLETWRPGVDLVSEYRRIEIEVCEAAKFESEAQQRIREEVLPKLGFMTSAPAEAGHYEVNIGELKRIHQEILFCGRAEACDGTNQMYDTLAMTIHQIGVCLVSYSGNQGSWSQRLFRRDLRENHGDPVEQAISLLRNRDLRGALDHEGRERLSELAQRAVMSYAEAAVLLKRSQAPWRIGHGSPAPYQLLTGNGDFMIESIKVMRDLIAGHQRFLYVTSEPADRAILTIGQSLRPMEYAVIGTLNERIHRFTESLSIPTTVTVDDRWDGERLTPLQWVTRFRDEVASQVLYGVYRASGLAPAQIFYGHRNHIHEAAKIAMADSVFLPHRGFPLLIDLADRACHSTYGGASLQQMADMAFAKAGAAFRYGSERQSRV